MARRIPLFLVLVLCFGGTESAVAQRFLPDDPLWTDPDSMNVSFPEPEPGSWGRGPFEFVGRTFGTPGEHSGPALNVNTLGEVPNSTWYTNHHYHNPLSAAELRRGPNEKPGPSREGPWRVTRLVRRGDLPQMVVRDADGRRFQLLFDAAAHPEMATGAAMIGSRLLYALGYNVPHHWLRRLRAERLVPYSETDLTPAAIDSLLAEAPRRPDSTYRVLVTQIPDVARRIGPFTFHGTRSDDGNDIFPHEARRELRGLKVFAAWINHSNIAPRHTLDVGVRVDGRQFVRHYLTDLHLTLGSGGATPNPSWAGHEHVLELDRVLKRIGTLGLSGGEWTEDPVPEWPAVGHFEADHFEPTRWRPEWPNPAFQQCDPADAFWAAKQVRHFTASALEAVVASAEYSTPAVDQYIQTTLRQRRDSIAQAYLHWGGGLGRFEVQDGQLIFQDLRTRHGLVPDTVRRSVTWRVYDNEAERVGERLRRDTSSREAVVLPRRQPSFLQATLKTPRVGTTVVYLRRVDGDRPAGGTLSRYEVVGVERTGPEDASC